jgi:tetratricopeptide (TPR) repeat protein
VSSHRKNVSEISGSTAISVYLLDPATPHAIHALALNQVESGHDSVACKILSRLVRLVPSNAGANKNYALCLRKLGRSSEAAHYYRRLLSLAPDDAAGWEGLGTTATELEIRACVAAPFFRSLALQPDTALAHSNLGGALHLLGRFDQAASLLRQSIALTPGSNKTYLNLGNTCKVLGELDASALCYSRSLIIAPGDPSSTWNQSMLLLLKGDLKEGFRRYESRLKLTGYRPARFTPWDGADAIEGRTLLVRAEQGLGDTLQFCRFIDGLLDRKASISFAVPLALHALLGPSLTGVTLHEDSDALSTHDFEVSLMSLPAILGIEQSNLPFRTKYLVADPRRRAKWSEVLPSAALKVGIAWQGKLTSAVEPGRSFSLDCFAGVASIPGVQLISLQKGRATEQLSHLAAHLNLYVPDERFDEDGAFVDTAAIMMSLDLVITSDTSIAHLAGALGVPVWVVLQRTPEWRWMLGRDDSPWYPTMRLFRQTRNGSWGEPFAEIIDSIAPLLRPGLQ